MSPSARTAAPLFAGVAAALGIGIAAASPAVAAPGDSADAGSAPGAAAVPPVVSTIDGMINPFIPPNAIVPRSPVGAFAERFAPTTGQVRDFFGFIQQFRLPAPIVPPG